MPTDGRACPYRSSIFTGPGAAAVTNRRDGRSTARRRRSGSPAPGIYATAAQDATGISTSSMPWVSPCGGSSWPD